MISVVINTCAGSKDPRTLDRLASFGNSGKKRYGERADKLRVVIDHYRTVPRLDLIIVGEWECGEGYRYVHCPGPTRSPTDPPVQRHAAAAIALYELIVFLNDDHYVPVGCLDGIWNQMRDADVGAFTNRIMYRKDGTSANLETGYPEYVMGHACVMSKDALVKVPWNIVPNVEKQDIEHTRLLRAADLKITPILVPIYDIEVGEVPDE